MNSIHLTRASVLALAALCAGCAADAAPGGPPPHRLDPQPLAAALSVLDYRPGDLFMMDPGGRLLLSDADAGQLIVYSMEGKEEARMGGKGAGPAEHVLPSGALVGPDGRMVVADAMLRRLSVFDARRRLVATHPLPGMPMHLLGWSGDGVLLAWLEGADAGPVVGRVDLATGRSRPLYRVYERIPELRPAAASALDVNPWLAATWAPDGRVLMARVESYRVVAVDALTGTVRQRFGRADVERERPTRREAAETEARLAAMFRTAGMPAEASAGLIREARERPKPFFLMNAFAADARGRLWIATQRGGDGHTELDLFDADGTFLRTVAVRDRVRRIAVSLPYLAVLVERRSGPQEGAEGVDVYRVDALP